MATYFRIDIYPELVVPVVLNQSVANTLEEAKPISFQDDSGLLFARHVAFEYERTEHAKIFGCHSDFDQQSCS